MLKRFLPLILALALVLGCRAEGQPLTDKSPDSDALSPITAVTDTAALPQIGQTVNGFEAVEQRDFPMMNAVVVRFVHLTSSLMVVQ